LQGDFEFSFCGWETDLIAAGLVAEIDVQGEAFFGEGPRKLEGDLEVDLAFEGG
jgi:hypothetical protein